MAAIQREYRRSEVRFTFGDLPSGLFSLNRHDVSDMEIDPFMSNYLRRTT